jgi:hypothetical protein
MLSRVWQEFEYRINVFRVTVVHTLNNFSCLKNLFSFPVAVNNSIKSCLTFWVVLRRMVFNSRRFGTRSVPYSEASGCIHAPMRMVQCSETSAIKHLTPENNPKINTRRHILLLCSGRCKLFVLLYCIETQRDVFD